MSNKTTIEKAIIKDIDQNTSFSELRLKRNAGELTPEVIQMCSNHLDEMIAAVFAAWPNIKFKDIGNLVEELRSKPKVLVNVNILTDDYIEVLHWHGLTHEKLIFEVTKAHREVDCALFEWICDKLSENSKKDVFKLIYSYGCFKTNRENSFA